MRMCHLKKRPTSNTWPNKRAHIKPASLLLRGFTLKTLGGTLKKTHVLYFITITLGLLIIEHTFKAYFLKNTTCINHISHCSC